MRGMSCAMVLVMVLPTLACKSKARVCEHARDRFVEVLASESRLAEDDALDDQKVAAREYGKKIADALRDGFVAPCLELDGEELECMANIDAYAEAQLDANRGMLECAQKYRDDEAFEAHCEKWSAARKQANEKYGTSCTKVLDRIFEQAFPM